MNNLLRGALAGAAAWKLGGGLISTILIFFAGLLASRQMLIFFGKFRVQSSKFKYNR